MAKVKRRVRKFSMKEVLDRRYSCRNRRKRLKQLESEAPKEHKMAKGNIESAFELGIFIYEEIENRIKETFKTSKQVGEVCGMKIFSNQIIPEGTIMISPADARYCRADNSLLTLTTIIKGVKEKEDENRG